MKGLLPLRDYALVCLFFLGLSLWIGYPGYINNYYLYKFKGTYSKTQGHITSFSIKHIGPARSDASRLGLTVSYMVNGKIYKCRKLTWGAFSPGSMNDYSYIGVLYKKSSSIDVYYDPQNPQNSALLPNINGDDYAYQIGIGLFVVFLLLVGIYPMKNFRRSFMRF